MNVNEVREEPVDQSGAAVFVPGGTAGVVGEAAMAMS
jgi:hypothetical protein